jgi:hypothetical protein
MLRLQLVTTSEDRKEREVESEGDLLHGTAVLRRPQDGCTSSPCLSMGWLRSYFYSGLLHLQRRGRIAPVRLTPEICWRCEDCDKAIPEGISWAADAP